MTKHFSTLFLAAALSSSCLAQATESPAPSALCKPAIDSIQQTLVMLRPERWKTSEAIGKETAANLTSIQNDLQTTLPPLLTVADQHPDSIAQVLPAFRNISALYDVLLRVTQVATITAPGQQSAALQQSLGSLEAARRALGDNLQTAAVSENQQLHDLAAQLHTAQATPVAAPAACPPPPPPAPAKKRKPKPAVASQPAAPATP